MLREQDIRATGPASQHREVTSLGQDPDCPGHALFRLGGVVMSVEDQRLSAPANVAMAGRA